MSYLYDLFLIFFLVFIIINYIIWLKQIHLIFAYFFACLLLILDDNMDEESEQFSNKKVEPQGLLSFCLIFDQIQPSVA